MSEVCYMSQDGYDRLSAELEQLKTVERQKISKAIGEAIELGDLSENAEYHAAKEAQGLLELKINELERSLAFARIVDKSKLDLSNVTVLSKVKILNHRAKKEFVYQIVSEAESDIRAMKISMDSPIGQGLMGKKIGEIAEIETPSGVIKLEVLEISL